MITTLPHVLILGCGRSSTVLIHQVALKAQAREWKVTIGDADIKALEHKLLPYAGLPKVEFSAPGHMQAIADCDVVISLLPPAMHIFVAKECLKHGKHLITASYNTPEMQLLHNDALQKGLVFLMECGLDPGLDHISAMLLIDKIKSQGGEITGFQSFCGGLTESDVRYNPWDYYITWNPQNVVLAGQGLPAVFLKNGQIKYLNYERLFTDTFNITIHAQAYEGYANRESLHYQEIYGLEKCQTFIRGTLRRKGFCDAWNILIQLGLTASHYVVKNLEGVTYSRFFKRYLSDNHYYGFFKSAQAWEKVEWLWNDNTFIGLSEATPAQVLQLLIQKKWALPAHLKDEVVMQHIIDYTRVNETKQLTSTLQLKGTDNHFTAMAQTVGLPLLYACEYLLKYPALHKGVQLPVDKSLGLYIIQQLASQGITFTESE